MHRVSLLAAILLTACVSSSDIERLQSQVSDLQDQISDLKRVASSREDVQKINESLAKQTEAITKQSADLRVKVDELDDRLQNAQGGIEQTNYRIDRIVQQLTQAQKDVAELKLSLRMGAPAGGSSGGEIRDEINVEGPSEDPLEVYQSAYRDYQRGNYDLALQGFRDYLKKNPNTDLSDNAAYWIGESLFSQRKHREAIAQFDQVITSFPKSDKVPAALLKKGYAYVEVGEKAQGVIQLQYVIHEHPSSQEASLARQKLKSLGIEVK
ncbi:MAG TPA: tol-pal system protein YbgF [Thermoanaerobaculia bacterium]